MNILNFIINILNFIINFINRYARIIFPVVLVFIIYCYHKRKKADPELYLAFEETVKTGIFFLIMCLVISLFTFCFFYIIGIYD